MRARQPRVTERRIRKQETRERILQAAASIARREGLQAASIPRVMRAAGLTAVHAEQASDRPIRLPPKNVRAIVGDIDFMLLAFRVVRVSN